MTTGLGNFGEVPLTNPEKFAYITNSPVVQVAAQSRLAPFFQVQNPDDGVAPSASGSELPRRLMENHLTLDQVFLVRVQAGQPFHFTFPIFFRVFLRFVQRLTPT